LRIISGSHKGRKLHPLPQSCKFLRPTSDKAREAIFNILGRHVQDSRFLDLFAGTGAVGLEAYSRGARFIVFIENAPASLQILKKNLALFQTGAAAKGTPPFLVIKSQLGKKLPQHLHPSAWETPFDIVFADPPYDTGLSAAILSDVADGGILAEDGLFILEERKKAALPDQVGNLTLVDNRQYGENGFWLYRRLK